MRAGTGAVAQANDLRDLFTYHGDDVGATTETGDLFAGLDVEAHAPPRKRPHPDRDQAHVEGNAVPWVHHAENDTGSRKRKGDDVDPGATHGGGRRGGNDGAVDRSSDGEADEADDDDTSILRRTAARLLAAPPLGSGLTHTDIALARPNRATPQNCSTARACTAL